MYNLEETEFIETYQLPDWIRQKKIEYLNKSIASNDIESIIKKLPTNRSTWLYSFPGEFYQTFKEDFVPILLKLFKKTRRKLLISLYKAHRTLIPKWGKDTKNKIAGQYPWWI